MSGGNGMKTPLEIQGLEVLDTPTEYRVHALAMSQEGREYLRQIGKPIDSKRAIGMDRPFVAWDGEGITFEDGKPQSYVLFGNSLGDYIQSKELDTKECLDLMLLAEHANPAAIHVGFSIQYDANMILKDVGDKHLAQLRKRGVVHWKSYRLEYRPGKWFQVSYGPKDERTVCRIYDVWGFFQTSFIKAIQKNLPADDPDLRTIIEGKHKRGSFQWEEMETLVLPYWKTELRLLVKLMDELARNIRSADLAISSWHGPGALVTAVFRRHRIFQAKAETPKEVSEAARYAYAGGRFEQFRVGHHPGKVWQYDINSAYPNIIRDLPNLRTGHWSRETSFVPGTFSVWRVRWDSWATGHRRGKLMAQPFFHRDMRHMISYPQLVEGWYWCPEVELAQRQMPGPLEILEGWVFHDDGTKPFAYIEEMYETRRRWKAEGIGAEYPLKLVMNSMYGKLAQRVGWESNGKIPLWHQLEWAGYVTSATRAKLYNAIRRAGLSIIACETDAVFTTRPIKGLNLGKKLGEWDATEHDYITYLQSGVYFTPQGPKFRGFDLDSFSHSAVLAHLDEIDSTGNWGAQLYGKTTRFTGMGLASRTDGTIDRSKWRRWTTEERRLLLGGETKRRHLSEFCPACESDEPVRSNLHYLGVFTRGGMSHPHTIPWISEEPINDFEAAHRWAKQ
jgi:DNA polymerase type B, organellar and viral